MKQVEFLIDTSSNALESAVPRHAETIDLDRITKVFWRQRRVAYWSVALALLAGVFYLATTPKYFGAESALLVDGNINGTISQVTELDQFSTTDTALESAQLVITSDEIARRVVQTLGLVDNPTYLNPPESLAGRAVGGLKSGIKALLSPLMPSPAANLPPATEESRIAAVATELKKKVKVSRIGLSTGFAISYRSHDPALAAAVANAYAEAYVSDVLNANFVAIQRMTEWMQTRLVELETAAREAGEDVEAFRAAHGLTSSSTPMSQEAVSSLGNALTTAISEVTRAQAKVNALDAVVRAGPEAFLTGVPSALPTFGDPKLQELQRTLSDALNNLNRIKRDFGADHPQVPSYERRARETSDLLYAEISQNLDRARGELALAQEREQTLRDRLGLAMNEDAEQGTEQVRLRALEQRSDTLSRLYQNFLSKMQEVDQQKTFPISNVRILSTAEVPTSAAGPSAPIVLALAVVFGLMAATFVAGLREWRDRYLRTAEQVREALHLPFLGYLPAISEAAPTSDTDTGHTWVFRRSQATPPPVVEEAPPTPRERMRENSVYVMNHMRSPFAETLRNVRLAVQLKNDSDKGVALGLTSARPQEGKTTIAMNLAAIFAASGASVLLIDGDTRHPTLSRKTRTDWGAGLIEVLIGEVSWEEAARQLPGTGVRIIPAVVPEDFSQSGELIGGPAMKSLLAKLRKEFDYVIVDLAPMGPVIDARLILPELSQLILVAEWGKTSRALLRGLVGGDAALLKKLTGVILNKVDMRKLPDFAGDADGASYIGDYGDYY